MIQLRLLGSLELTSGDGSQILSILSQPKRASLLAYLAAATPRGFHRRDKLLAIFWPESDEEHARNSLRQSLHFLRRSLGDEAIPSRGDDEVGIGSKNVWCDVIAFDAALEAGDLEGALALYRGDFLAGFHVQEAPDFERWVDAETQRARERAARAAEQLRDRAHQSGDTDEALDWARRAVAIAPANGQAVRGLIEALADRGDRAGAIRAYDSFIELLGEEFAMEPPEALSELVREIRTGETRAEGDALPLKRSDRAPPDVTPRSLPAAPSSSSTPLWVWPALTMLGAILLAVGMNSFWPEASDGSGDAGASGLGGNVGLRVLVLPLVDRSSDESLREITQELLDEITTALGRVETLAPLDRSTALRLAREGRDPAAAAAELNVPYFVSGNIRPTGAQQRASIQLVATESGVEAWSSQYDLQANRIDDQVRVARDVARQIEIAVQGGSMTGRPTVGGTTVDEAFVEYLTGYSVWIQRNPLLLERALASYGRATQLDPGYALAYSAMADVYNLLGAYDYGVRPPTEVIPAAASAAQTAINLEPDLGEAWVSLGVTHLIYDWDVRGAREAFDAALERSPEYAPAHHWYSLMRVVEGDPVGSMGYVEHARELEPVSPVLRGALARNYYYRRDYGRSIEIYDEAISLEPDFTPAHIGKGLSLLLAGRPEEALASYRTAQGIIGQVPLVLAVQGHVLGIMGQTEAAATILAQLTQYRDQVWVPSEYLGIVHLGMGNLDEAVASFEQAYGERSGAMAFLHVDPMLDPLREHARWQALIDRVGIER